MKEFVSISVEQTQEYAERMARRAEAGDVILLIGDLGAGKTHFTQGFARGLGMSEIPTSPTFNLVCEYCDGRLPLYHFDLYRLESADELDDIDYYAITEGDGVSLVEWGDKFEEAAPDDYLLLDFSVEADGARTIRAYTHGPRSEVLVVE
ncbi:MAG: tRNA (adenosine(37)-N6)-threonylcarbamoyltransferase complex ATPase subunit type 1 TsaE [Slackia sp.]|nr:tRNA (adenosine(37)-N6)-threonylcarbamoyltransferase complex ATPase subunit type 1 TsaE [Slackia sp.]